MSASEVANSLGGAITSPAKLGFAAYVLFVYWGKLTVHSGWEFLGIVALFFIAQVGHDDYFRKVLNNCADKKPPKI